MSRLINYAVVGLVSNGLGLAAFQALVIAGTPPETAAFTAFFIAFGCAYRLNRSRVFRSRKRHEVALVQYTLAIGFVLILHLGLVALLYRAVGLVPFAAQVTALAVVVPVSFLLQRFWVFRVPGAKPVCRS